ncbi:hypothetical protein [Moraxella lacunata]
MPTCDHAGSRVLYDNKDKNKNPSTIVPNTLKNRRLMMGIWLMNSAIF